MSEQCTISDLNNMPPSDKIKHRKLVLILYLVLAYKSKLKGWFLSALERNREYEAADDRQIDSEEF